MDQQARQEISEPVPFGASRFELQRGNRQFAVVRDIETASEIRGVYAALVQIERLSRTADRNAVDVPAMLGDIARAALAKVPA